MILLSLKQAKLEKKLKSRQSQYLVKRQRLQQKMAKRRQKIRGTDRKYWRILASSSKKQWRINRHKLPKEIWRSCWRLLGLQLEGNNYPLILRLYLVLLLASDKKWRDKYHCLSEYL
ncbi:MAG: hypothetical protein AXA67_08870 [Methylothermaceae bacteria B42]|nr:MAG: hypothetical protein AXA67_08870 [Methylothermaceae bacteria B42]HHJ39415.1 hypothetical protein [Methylothermaceae bacterium]